MKHTFFCKAIVLICFSCLSSAISKADEASSANEIRQLQFAENVITIELARALSHSMRSVREQCRLACPEIGALELAIGLIGLSRTAASNTALVNLLGLRLDGAGSEELSCQLLIRGRALSRGLKQIQAREVAEHCQSTFLELKKRELANVTDVTSGQVCRSETEIQKAQDEWYTAIELKEKCEQ